MYNGGCFDMSALIILAILGLVFFWLGTGLSIVIFKEKIRNDFCGELAIDKFYNLFIGVNIILSLIFISINDFRVTLFSTALLFCVYSIVIRIIYRKTVLQEHRKEPKRNFYQCKQKQGRYF